MRMTRTLLAVFIFFVLATSAHALSPREQLNQMVQQLQKTPSDNVLREKIIKLALTVKPSPTVTDSAVAFEGRAQFAFKSAKSEGDYLAAAQEYEKAVTAAPWVPGYYADLCTVYEKAGKYEDAKRHCGFYLLGLTDLAQITDVKRRIAGLEFGIEKANSPEARAAKQAFKDEDLIKNLDGAIFFDPRDGTNTQFRVDGPQIVISQRRHYQGHCLCDGLCNGLIDAELFCTRVLLAGRKGEITAPRNSGNSPVGTIEITEDGRTLKNTVIENGKTYTITYSRKR